MYINRIVLRDVRNFKHLDLTLKNDWTQEPLKSVLITGPNGSGKSTLLRVIAALWRRFETWLNQGGASESKLSAKILSNVNIAAIEIKELLEGSVWLYVANSSGLNELEAIMLSSGRLPSHTIALNFSQFSIDKTSELEALNLQRERLLVGTPSTALLPNMVFLEAENRQVPALKFNRAMRQEIHSESLYQWLMTYEMDDRRSNLETMLRNHKIRDPKDFERLINQINSFLGEKEIADFDSQLRLMVRAGDIQHPISDLSSGEKQCLIMMFMVSRWLMPGGIVLIDEPDLHLHVSLQRHFIHELEKVVLEKGGQMIVTSHSPTLWEEYNQRQRIDLGALEQA